MNKNKVTITDRTHPVYLAKSILKLCSVIRQDTQNPTVSYELLRERVFKMHDLQDPRGQIMRGEPQNNEGTFFNEALDYAEKNKWIEIVYSNETDAEIPFSMPSSINVLTNGWTVIFDFNNDIDRTGSLQCESPIICAESTTDDNLMIFLSEFEIHDKMDHQLAQQLIIDLEALMAEIKADFDPIINESADDISTYEEMKLLQLDQCKKVESLLAEGRLSEAKEIIMQLDMFFKPSGMMPLVKKVIEGKAKSYTPRLEAASKLCDERSKSIVQKYRQKIQQRAADQKKKLCDDLSSALAVKVIGAAESGLVVEQTQRNNMDGAAKTPWRQPGVPVRLLNMAQCLFDAGGTMEAGELKRKIGFDPSRIYTETAYQIPRHKLWIKTYIRKIHTGLYQLIETHTERTRKRIVKHSK